ncbi:MAG: hypothetical protein Q7S60_04320 [bacterium]|nr:hypothetical protein [bacterium]
MDANNQDNTPISPDQYVPLHWRVKTLKLFIKALQRYRELLQPHASQGNEKIRDEMTKINKLATHFREAINRGDGHWDLISLQLTGSTIGWLSDILHKYWRSKESLLQIQKQKTFVEGALEAEEKEVEELKEVLQNSLWERVDRIKVLVPDFVGQTANDSKDSERKSEIKQQITVGNLYGQVVFGDNFGNLNQGNTGETIKLLQELFNKIVEEKELPNEIKSDAIGDIQTIQSQVLKSKPDKGIIQTAMTSLQVLANASQVAQFAMIAVPYIDKLKQLIEKIAS